MFDASFFKTALPEHLKASGEKPTVEVHLINSHTHRLRGILERAPTYIVFEAYRQRVDGGRIDQHWGATSSNDSGSGDTLRVIAAYESIAEVVITPTEDSSAPRIGFVRA